MTLFSKSGRPKKGQQPGGRRKTTASTTAAAPAPQGGRKKQYNKVPYGMPTTYLCKMRYAAPYNGRLTSTSAGIGSFVFRCSSIFDPEHPIGGTQPRYRDQLGTFYNKYCVYGCKIHLDFFFKSGSTTNNATFVGVILNNSPTAFVNYSDVREERVRSLKTIQPQNPKCTVSLVYKPRLHWGIPKKDSIKNSPGMSALISQDVTGTEARNAYFHVVAMCPTLGTGEEQDIYYTGYIEYLVHLFDTKLPSAS